jgi:hypothetical protein
LRKVLTLMRYRLFFFLTAAVVVVLGISGCGGEGKSSDPLGTDSLTFGDASGSAVLKLDTDGAVQLTAKVKDAAGKAVADREVFFDIVSNASGATLSSTKVVTNTAGEATILYRAGAASGSDVVRAFISNGVRMDVSITVSGIVPGARIALAAAPASLAAGQNSILTATVTDSAGSPLKGQAVTFAFSNNSSGATLVTVNGTTDVSGRAIAVYTAGAANPTQNVQDTVLAGVAGSPSVGAVIITRTATGASGITVSIAASATSLAAGQIAVITATVTDGASAPVIGQAVTFTLSANNSGAALVTLSGATDVSGRAIAQYTAGANSPTTSVQDTVLASVTGSTAAVVITRTVGTATGFQIGVTATPTTLAAGATSIIVATVTNANGTVAPGQPVSFAFVSNASGANLSPLNSGITDAGGKALAVYTAGSFSPNQTVQDVITAAVPGAVAAAIITRQAATVTGNRISSLTAIPSILSSATGGTSIVTATVVGGAGVTPVPGVTVTFDVLAGGGSFVTPTATSANDGRANGVFTSPSNPLLAGTQSVVRATIAGSDAVVIINWVP